MLNLKVIGSYKKRSVLKIEFIAIFQDSYNSGKPGKLRKFCPLRETLENSGNFGIFSHESQWKLREFCAACPTLLKTLFQVFF